jgi:DNA-binding NtrC family response regulator
LPCGVLITPGAHSTKISGIFMTSLFSVHSMGIKRSTLIWRQAVSWLQVLVACSDPDRRSALVDILAQLGLEPVIATDMGEVRTIFAERPLHLLFCEDGLPQGGFRELLRLAKATGSQFAVVVCSLLGELDQYLEAMQLGAFDFIAPPYRRGEVEFIVDSVRKNYLLKRMGGTHPYVQGAVCREDDAAA